MTKYGSKSGFSFFTELIAQHLLKVHEGNNWTDVDLTDTLTDISFQEAFALTPASPNTIAGLLQHISFWNRVMVERLKGVKVDIPQENGFKIPGGKNDEIWQHIMKDNLHSAHELADAIRSFDERKLYAPILPDYSSVYKHLQGSVEHVHYHLGQIVI